jgi:AGCS family alanine or glycine:cation symporter
MVVLYGGTSLVIILLHADQIFPSLSLILSDAFTGQAVAGGALGMVIVTGVRRAAFSNEAGMGTEAMAHGAAKTKQPIREGVVAMWGPVIDTLIMCTLTALVLMVTDVWRSGEGDGVLLTRHYPELVPICYSPACYASAFHRCLDFPIMW